jgi:hypothetical protein
MKNELIYKNVQGFYTGGCYNMKRTRICLTCKISLITVILVFAWSFAIANANSLVNDTFDSGSVSSNGYTATNGGGTEDITNGKMVLTTTSTGGAATVEKSFSAVNSGKLTIEFDSYAYISGSSSASTYPSYTEPFFYLKGNSADRLKLYTTSNSSNYFTVGAIGATKVRTAYDSNYWNTNAVTTLRLIINIDTGTFDVYRNENGNFVLQNTSGALYLSSDGTSTGTSWKGAIDSIRFATNATSTTTKVYEVDNVKVYTVDYTASLYVSNNGSDNNDGSINQPFQTLEKARDKIRCMNVTGDVCVYLRGGDYNRTSSFSLDSRDSGTASAKITYKAYPGETVKINGAYTINQTLFQSVTDSSILNRLPSNDSRNNIKQIILSNVGITNYGTVAKFGSQDSSAASGTELFINDNVMTLGRWPNSGYALTGSVINGAANQSVTFLYNEDRPAYWTAATDAYMEGYWYWDWYDSSMKINTINTSTKQISTVAGNPYGALTGKRYFAYNLLEEIDMPGEWYLDRTTGILYLYPPTGFDQNAKIQLSYMTDSIVAMNNAVYVNFDGIIFEATTGSAFEINGANHNLINNCTFRNIGKKGIVINSGTDTGITNCNIYQIGKGGVSITGGERTTLTAGNNYVENCDIYNFNRLVKTNQPGIYLAGVGNRASHNKIHESTHQAVLFGGNNHVLEYNIIYNVLTETSDAGAVYSGRNWTYRGNIIRYNYFHDIGDNAIYLDDMISGTEIKGNIFYKAKTAVFVNGGRDNTINENLIFDCNSSVVIVTLDCINNSYYMNTTTGVFYVGLNSVPYQTAPWSTQYPTLATITSDPNPSYPKGNVVQSNTVYNTPDISLSSYASQYGSVSGNILKQMVIYSNQ